MCVTKQLRKTHHVLWILKRKQLDIPHVNQILNAMKYHFFERITLTLLLLLFVIHAAIYNPDLRPNDDPFLFILFCLTVIFILYSFISIMFDYNQRKRLEKWNRQRNKRNWK